MIVEITLKKLHCALILQSFVKQTIIGIQISHTASSANCLVLFRIYLSGDCMNASGYGTRDETVKSPKYIFAVTNLTATTLASVPSGKNNYYMYLQNKEKN